MDDLIIHEHELNIERTVLKEQSVELFPCISCDKIYDEIEDLIDHYGETAYNIED